MKTNSERLAAALEQVDDTEWISLTLVEGAIRLDGAWDVVDVDAALDTHLVPLSSVIEQHEAKAMFLRQVWATGTTGDGREFEISASGPTLILAIGPFDDSREVYTIPLEKLAPAWLRAVGAQGS